ncbi:MAG: hypothetical protein AAF415_15175 [Pseudomonadota bacterium]
MDQSQGDNPSDSSTVIKAFEKRIDDLETEKRLLDEKQSASPQLAHSFDEIFERAMSFLANPWNIYQNGSLVMKKLVLRLAFKAPMAYDRRVGFERRKLLIFLGYSG